MPYLSETSKMNCPSWGIPARECQTGGKLRKAGREKGKMTPCRFCYAFSGRMAFPSSQKRLEENLIEWREDREKWIQRISVFIDVAGCRYFRWFHSGDLQGIEMLHDIVGG